MGVRRQLLAVPLLLGTIAASDAWAGPITWQASGTIDALGDTFGLLDPVAVGTSWSLQITFDSNTAATPTFCGGPSYRYAGAIIDTTFQIGGFAFQNNGGDIFTNFSAPLGSCGSPSNSLGLVQFQWIKGWTGPADGPNLNGLAGLLFASYRDTNSHNGSLPTVPSFEASQSPFAGLEWDGVLGPGLVREQFTSGFRPSAAPVPEPTTIVLCGIGGGFLIRAARRRRSS
jgi:hypothetical protein